MRTLITLSLVLGATALGSQLTACGGDDGGSEEESFDNFQDCFDDHTSGDEDLPTDKAITVCCLEHPIAGQDAGVVCGATAASCNTYVTANLASADATPAEITAACTDYETQSK